MRESHARCVRLGMSVYDRPTAPPSVLCSSISLALLIGVDRISKVGVPGDRVWRQCLESSFHLSEPAPLHHRNNCQKVEVPGTITLKKWGCPGIQAPMITTLMALLNAVVSLL
jgi:hypothetical protein